MQQKIIVLLIIIILSALGLIATDIYLPSMPSMAKYFDVGLNIVQFSISIYVLGFGIGALLYGPLSDRFGRKPVIIFCLITSVLGSLCCSIADNIIILFIGRLIQGFSLSGASVIARSITKDISQNQIQMAKMGSILGIVFPFVTAMAPIIGGYIEKYAYWRWNFIALILLTLILFGLIFKKLPETNTQLRVLSFKKILNDYLEVISNKTFMKYNIISALVVAGTMSYQAISSYLLQVKVGLSPEIFGYTSLIIAFSFVGGGLLNSKMVTNRGINKMLQVGCFLFIISGVLLFTFGIFDFINVYTVMLPIMIFVAGSSIIYPTASAGAMNIFANKAGTAASVYTFLQMIGGTMGSSLISISKHLGQLQLGELYIILGFIGFIIMLTITPKVIKQELIT
ncbi:MAG TPA: multidrug effflux MFS transporter [Burkholderiales bacterium]|nr:multidrug effflux MFS transporter [Burkholderiales bacterium]